MNKDLESLLREKFSANPETDNFDEEVIQLVESFKPTGSAQQDKENVSYKLAEILTQSLGSKYEFDDVWPISAEIVEVLDKKTQ